MVAMSLLGAFVLGWLVGMAPKKRPAIAGGAAGSAAASDADCPGGDRKPKADEAVAEADAEGQAGADREVKLVAGSPSKRAPKGARDQVATNEMLTGSCQQKAGKDPDKAVKAAAALEMHHQPGWEEKESMAERCKGNEARGSMKWIDDWMGTRSKECATAAGWNENWRGPGQVLQLLGLNLSDFETREEALAFVAKEVRRNQVASGTLESHPPKIDESSWLMMITGEHAAQLESRANDCNKAIQSGRLEFALGAHGGDEVKQQGGGAEAAETLDDPGVGKYAEASKDLGKVYDALNTYQDDAEAIATIVDDLAKNGITKLEKAEGDKEKAIKTFEEECESRAKQCDERRKAGDERAKNAAPKVTEMQGKHPREPSERS
ncbi:unnamed protein product [Prorocentrum cordatum]|uniref:Uncharacterized protein n=1 Tax=Prorocentrum cordatum TaxID=2364126 RepID=A0ABN9WT37_9DINO|nr:unnamed protein product [Polarella glacialis]